MDIAFRHLHSLQWICFFSCIALYDIFHIFAHTFTFISNKIHFTKIRRKEKVESKGRGGKQ